MTREERNSRIVTVLRAFTWLPYKIVYSFLSLSCNSNSSERRKQLQEATLMICSLMVTWAVVGVAVGCFSTLVR